MDGKHEGATAHEVASNGHSTGAKRGGIFNTLYPPGPKPGAGGRIKNHCRRFWWCDVLVTIVVVLVIVLPIIFVAIPKKAQSDINDSTLEVTRQDVLDPTNNSAYLILKSVAKSDSAFHPTIEGFRASLSLKDKEPFTYIDIPEIKAEKETNISVEQTITIEDADRFAEYNKLVLKSEEYDVYLSGKTKVHQKGLQAMTVDYNKKVTMKGLNGLKGLKIYNLTILQGKDEILEDGSNLIGTVDIPNPSVMTLDLGNVTMNLAVDGKSIGFSLIPKLKLKPGLNTVPMQSTVSKLTVISLVSNTYTDGIIPLDITGNKSVSEDGNVIPYFTKAIQDNLINVDLDADPALKKLGLNITKGRD